MQAHSIASTSSLILSRIRARLHTHSSRQSFRAARTTSTIKAQLRLVFPNRICQRCTAGVIIVKSCFHTSVAPVKPAASIMHRIMTGLCTNVQFSKLHCLAAKQSSTNWSGSREIRVAGPRSVSQISTCTRFRLFQTTTVRWKPETMVKYRLSQQISPLLRRLPRVFAISVATNHNLAWIVTAIRYCSALAQL